ncbi:MAG: hypothetical protein DI556_13550 [Rhodovulum sulfidophilum]|uniref:Conjugal transfer protein TraF n=1 Tax=Rhodovulum sulfidophilum TaxID=35806 RepID=A0A2W5NDM4_RHOSU|nr:MAG: hypothetical protein DI556_13550 [Rhodovulum sulfidophilum]
MRLCCGLPAVIVLSAMLPREVAGADVSQFFDDRARGWFWYEDPAPEPEVIEPEPEPVALTPPAPIPEPEPTQAPPAAEAPTPGSTAWLREAMPLALDVATDDPTPENVERYFLLQREALDKSERFSEVAQLISTGHPTLDENRRRPRADQFAKMLDGQAAAGRQEVLRDLFSRSALVLFVDRNCSACAMVGDNLHRLSQTHGLIWRVVSLDGTILPPQFNVETAFDQGISEQLGVTTGGAIFLATPPNRFDPVTWNPTAGAEITERVVSVAYRAGLISPDQYQMTRAVNAPVSAALDTPVGEIPDILRQADELLRSDGIRVGEGDN